MPPSFSRFRLAQHPPTKRPRQKSLQPKTFIPASSIHGLPRPIDIAPDPFEFPLPAEIPSIHFDNLPNDTIPPLTTASTNVLESVHVVTTSSNGAPLTTRAVPIAPKPPKRATGVLPLASRAPWLLYEDRLLNVLVGRYGEDWLTMSAHFSDRSAIQVQRRWNDHLKVSRKWTREEGNVISKIHGKNPEQWDKVAAALKGRTAASARYHWYYDFERGPEYGFR